MILHLDLGSCLEGWSAQFHVTQISNSIFSPNRIKRVAECRLTRVNNLIVSCSRYLKCTAMSVYWYFPFNYLTRWEERREVITSAPEMRRVMHLQGGWFTWNVFKTWPIWSTGSCSFFNLFKVVNVALSAALFTPLLHWPTCSLCLSLFLSVRYLHISIPVPFWRWILFLYLFSKIWKI